MNPLLVSNVLLWVLVVVLALVVLALVRQVGVLHERITPVGALMLAKGLKVGVLRHYWEKDMPAHPDLAQAMDAAIDQFKKLGAKVEDCQTRPMQDSFDCKVLIGESEIYSIHYDNLKSRPGDFGSLFQSPPLPLSAPSAHLPPSFV